MIKSDASPDTALDRQCEQRGEPGYMAAVLDAGNYKVVVFHEGRALMDGRGLAYLELGEHELQAGGTLVYLGRVAPDQAHPLPEGTDLVLLSLPDGTETPPTVPDPSTAATRPFLSCLPESTAFAGYRDVAPGLNALDKQVFVEAQAVANWHSTHTHCPRCGSGTAIMNAGWMRQCKNDGSQHFPRTDPAAIVAIVGSDDRILLASNFKWPENRYSTVAGFAEAGESGEQAAVREIAEEVGVHLHSLTYVGSQAWPFPRSFMLGFIGYTNDAVATPDNTEVRSTRWFGREELQAAVLSGAAVIPGRLSIARTLVERWYGGAIREPGDAAESFEAAESGETA